MSALAGWSTSGIGYLPVAEHLAQARLLVRPNDGRRFQIYVQVGVNRIIPEIVLLQHRVFKFIASLFNVLKEANGK